jgi:hypothetical protein
LIAIFFFASTAAKTPPPRKDNDNAAQVLDWKHAALQRNQAIATDRLLNCIFVFTSLSLL